MTSQTVKIVAIAAAVIVAITIAVAWKISSSQNLGPRPGVDIPMRGM
jgi:hypothetical protein